MPKEIKPEEYKKVLEEKAIIEFIHKNQPIREEIIFKVFPITDLVLLYQLKDLEKNGSIKNTDRGWIYDFSLSRSDYWEIRKDSKEFDPSTVECLIREGNIFLKHNKFPEATLRFEKVLKRDKKNIDALDGLRIAKYRFATPPNKRILTKHQMVLGEKLVAKNQELAKNIRLQKKYGLKHPIKYKQKIKKLRAEIAQIRKKPPIMIRDVTRVSTSGSRRIRNAKLEHGLKEEFAALRKQLEDQKKRKKR